MAELHPENERPNALGAETGNTGAASEAARLDRRSFLRALSGSALTIVAGGLTVTLAACQGASTSNPIVSTTNLQTDYPPLPGAPSGSNGSLGSIANNPSGSSGSNSSSLSSGSNSSGSSSSGSSASLTVPPAPTIRRQAVASLQPREFRVDGWSTRV